MAVPAKSLRLLGGKRRHWHEGGRLRRRRIFDHGDLRFLILQLIAESPKHGYEIIKAIEDRLAGTYTPSPGVVYPTLTLLEELGYVTLSTSEGNRKPYAVTPVGTAYLQTNKASVDAVFERITASRASQDGEPPSQVIRAMENLRLALSLRLARGRLSETQARAIAAVIDDAAIAVERT
jgi:DNA-binding PadR family transcriptional regulator